MTNPPAIRYKHAWRMDRERVCRCALCNQLWTKENRYGECPVRLDNP